MSRAVLAPFEAYQKARVTFVQTVAELAQLANVQAIEQKSTDIHMFDFDNGKMLWDRSQATSVRESVASKGFDIRGPLAKKSETRLRYEGEIRAIQYPKAPNEEQKKILDYKNLPNDPPRQKVH